MRKLLLLTFFVVSLAHAGTMMQRGDTAGGDLGGTYPNPTVDTVVGGYNLFKSTSPFILVSNYPTDIPNLGIINVYLNADYDPTTRSIAVFSYEGTAEEITSITDVFIIGRTSMTSSVPIFSPSYYVNGTNIFISTRNPTALIGTRIYSSTGTIVANSSVTISVPGINNLFNPIVSEYFNSQISTVSVRIQEIFNSSYTIYNADVANDKNYVTWAFGR